MATEAAESKDVTRTDAWAAMRLRSVSRLRSPWVHDLRQPLHTVSLNLELLSRSLDRDDADAGEVDKRRRYLDVVRRRLNELQQGLQAYTDLLRLADEADERTSFDAARLTREVATLIGPLARRNGLDVEVEGGDGDARAELDGPGEAVRDLLVGIALEEIERLPSGSALFLRVGVGGRGGFIEVSGRDAGVADDPAAAAGSDDGATDAGSGGPASAALRPSETAARDLEGLARDLVTSLGGALEVRDEGGPGPVIRIELPLVSEGTDTSSREVGEP